MEVTYINLSDLENGASVFAKYPVNVLAVMQFAVGSDTYFVREISS
jgi:hypothetical protein